MSKIPMDELLGSLGLGQYFDKEVVTLKFTF